MDICIPSEQELSEIVEKAVKKVLVDELPSIVRKASRKAWLNTNELMELSGWSRRTIQYLRDARRIPFSQEVRRNLYPTDGIEEYLKSNLIRPRGRE